MNQNPNQNQTETTESNQCETCKYFTMPNDDGHCYMFGNEPEPICMQHNRFDTERKLHFSFQRDIMNFQQALRGKK